MILPMLRSAAASLSVYTGTLKEAVATYKDWVTGCDNVRNCSAIALAANQIDGEVVVRRGELVVRFNGQDFGVANADR